MEYSEIFKANEPGEAVKFFRWKLRYTLGPMDIEYARKGKVPTDFNLIDVRRAEDFNEGHIPGAINLPESEWSSLRGLSKDKLNVVYCYSQTCHLAAHAALFFAEKGFPVSEMEGGFEAYKEDEFEIEKRRHEGGLVRIGVSGDEQATPFYRR